MYRQPNWDGYFPSPPESAYMLCYHPSINRFTNEDGEIMHDLSDLFDVWELDEWKKTQEYAILQDRKGDWCELYYLSRADEADLEAWAEHGVYFNDQKFLYAT